MSANRSNGVRTEESGGASGDATLRVVVVGRTALHGVDAALRLDGQIELVRARTAMAALGELADPIDDRTPREAVVVVSPEAVAADRSAAFATAARRIVEGSRVLALTPHVPEGFDGCLTLDDATRPLASQVKDRSSAAVLHTRGRGEQGEAAVEQALAPLPATVSVSQSSHTALDSSPAVALATGRDPVEAVLEGIKRRLGVADVAFVADTAAQLPAAAEFAVPVAFGGRALGRLLVSAGAGAAAPTLEALAAEAEHLGAWVALSLQQEQLRHAAFTDELTGAWNRRYFNRFLAAAIEQAAGARHSVTLLAFDVDNFKTYNDRFGHAAGDEILVEIVRLLNAGIRSTDRVCRVGGDEFAVVFHDPDGPRGPAGAPTSPRSITDIVRRFQKQIVEHRFPKLGEHAPGTLTVSGGMATFPWDGRTVQQLLDRADELAMQSKQQGKNHITLGPGAEQACGPK